MKKLKKGKTEFYEAALKLGYYGNQDSGLSGKKDNVRKFWEDIFIKILCRPFIEKLLKEKTSISILDLGSGCGDGFELLTHIPPSNPKDNVSSNFLLTTSKIKNYTGIDLNSDLVNQSNKNFHGSGNINFIHADLKEGLPVQVLRKEPFDIYFSSYGALSYLNPEEFSQLMSQIFKHAANCSVIILDVYGKFSASWPKYWSEKNLIHPYTKAYLLKDIRKEIEWFNVCFWSASELKKALNDISDNTGIKIKIQHMLDRSIFIGRHMDTGLMNGNKMAIRYQVNRLLDHGYRGEPKYLELNLDYLKEYEDINEHVFDRLENYKLRWNKVIYFLEALLNHKDKKIKSLIENENYEELEEDFKLLAWLFRNSERFPVSDFWASIIGPQVAMILRNIEMSYDKGLGCGHGLVCAVEIQK